MTTSPEKWQTWIESRNRFFANPTGFLSVLDLVWLTDQPQEVTGLTGSWWAEGTTVHVKDSATGDHSWNVSERPETMFDFDGIVVELAERNNQMVVRPRDPNSPMLKNFEGVITFDYDASYCVEANFVPFDAPKEVVVDSVVDGFKIAYVSPGVLEFVIAGQAQKLTTFEKIGSEDLTIYYKDLTSGNLSYGTGRMVTANKQLDGTFIIDFNYSGNFPCSYTDFATCPVAPHENKLNVAVEAGEKKPIYRNTAEGIISQVH